ncbi:MAG: hypothetical protein L6N96_03375 [Candidatus Methylarchaceae archaeon HK02M2]|nr:hypothetical protein [Candidatus Methylarchaceae archaeon HK02M2]
MPSMEDAASKPERQAILRVLFSKSSGLTFIALSEKLQMKPEILQGHLKKLIKASLVLPPIDKRECYQISSIGRIVLKGLRQRNIRKIR